MRRVRAARTRGLPRLGSRSGRRGGRRWQGHKTGWRSLRVESLEDRTLLDAVRWINAAEGD